MNFQQLADLLQVYWRTSLLNGLLLLLLLVGHTLAYGSEDIVDAEEVTTGQLQLLGNSDQQARPALLESTDFDVTVNGMVARVVVTQVFSNPTDQWQEGEYIFPLPTDSAVDYMVMHIGERRIVGKIREKQQAKQIYDEAKRAGKKAALLVQRRPNLFSNRVANIGPGEKIQVALHYVQTLHYDQGRFSLRAPTTLTPRYIPGQAFAGSAHQANETLTILTGSGWALATDQVADAPHITPPMKPSGQAAPLTFTAQINGGLPLDSVDSLYHPAKVSQSRQQYQLTLKPGAKLDRDVVIEWQPAVGQAPMAAVFREQLKNPQQVTEEYLLLMLMPPQQMQKQSKLPRETIFIIDTSGSMGGNAIRQAKAALLNGLEKLDSGDRFNIIEFNSRTRHFRQQAMPATDANRHLGRQFVKGLAAGGGTEMLSVLRAAFANQAPEGFIRQVVFITDGSVGNEAALFTVIENERKDSRLFTVGIGSAPNSHFMEKAAQAGRGSFTYIASERDINRQMSDLFFKLEHPIMHDLQLDFGNVAVEYFPSRLPDLYAGEPLVVAVKAVDKLPDSISIVGQRANAPYRQTLSLAHFQPAQAISKVWARQKMRELADRKRQGIQKAATGETMQEAMTQLALAHQLMSPYTSFVAVAEEPARPLDKPLAFTAEANAMPAGNTMALPVPQTALGLNHLWALVLACLLAIVALHSVGIWRGYRGS